MALTNAVLVQLINSLSPSEKQYFKKQHEAKTDYVLLFDYLNKYKEFDTDKVARYLSKKNGAKNTLDKYTSGYISVIKQYLKEKITESLRVQYVQRRPNCHMLMRSINADILMERGFQELANDEIRLARKKMKTGMFPIEELMLLVRENLIAYYTDYEQISLLELHAITEQRLSLVNEIELEIKYARILSIIGLAQFHGLDISNEISQFKKDETLQSCTSDNSFSTTYLHHSAHGMVADYEKNKVDAIYHFEKATFHWLDYPDFVEIHSRLFMKSCSTYLQILQKHAAPEQLVLQIEQIDDLLRTAKKSKLSKEEMREFEKVYLMFKCAAFKNQNQYKHILNHLPKIEKILKQNSPLSKTTRLLFHYYIALSYFKTRQYEQALDWLQPIFVSNEIPLKGNPDYLSNIIILYLIVHFELGNYQFLQKLIKSKKKVLAKMNKWDKLREVQCNQLECMIKVMQNKASTEECIAGFLRELKAIEYDPQFNPPTALAFSMVEWVETRMVEQN